MIKGVATTFGLAAVLLALAAPAQAVTRAEYVAQADQVCKASNKPAKKLLKPLFKAFAQFAPASDTTPSKKQARRAARRFFRVIGRVYVRFGKLAAKRSDTLRTIPPPAEDLAVISSWIEGQYRLADDSFAIGRAAKHLDFKALGRAGDSLLADLQASDQLVAGFGFKYCGNPSQHLPNL